METLHVRWAGPSQDAEPSTVEITPADAGARASNPKRAFSLKRSGSGGKRSGEGRHGFLGRSKSDRR